MCVNLSNLLWISKYFANRLYSPVPSHNPVLVWGHSVTLGRLLEVLSVVLVSDGVHESPYEVARLLIHVSALEHDSQ